MLVIPAIDVMDGEAVQLVGGVPETAKRYGDPYGIAMRFADAGARRLHFVDLDSAMERDRGGGARALMERLGGGGGVERRRGGGGGGGGGWRSPALTGLPEIVAPLRSLRIEAILHTRLEIEGRLTGLAAEIVRGSL